MATSYTGLRVQDTYNAIIKIGDNSNLSATPKLLSDGVGNDTPLYLSGTRLGIGITPAYQFHTSGNAKIGGNLIISGNLTVNGTLTYLNVEDLQVEDPLIKLAKDNTSNTLDIGFFGKYVESATTKYTGLFWDASTDKFRLYEGLQVEPTTTVDVTGTGYTRSLLNADLEGNVTGTVSSLSNHDTNDLVEGSVNLYYTNARADARVNLQTGVNLDLSNKDTDDLSEGSTNLYFTTARARASFSAGTGVTITNGQIAIGQAVATTSNVNFNRITSSEDIRFDGTTSRFRSDTSFDFLFTDGTAQILKTLGVAAQTAYSGNSAASGMFNALNGYAVGTGTGTTVIDSSRNLTNIGTGNFSGQVTIPETPTADAHAASKKYVDDNTGTAEVAKRIDVTVKNVSGASLAKGVVVHAAPTATPPSGNVIEVIAADANVASSMSAIGVLNEAIADQAEGEAVMFGAVSGIDTSGFSIGDELYVSETAGEFTATKPTAFSSQVQKIAVVIKSHASNGLIKVFGAGRANDVPNRVDRDMNFTDDSELSFGDSSDLKIYHSTNNIVRINTGDLIFNSFVVDGDIKFQLDNGSGSLTEYMRLDGGEVKTIFSKSTRHNDDVKLEFGTNSDLEIFKFGAGDNFIRSNTGHLYLQIEEDDHDMYFQGDDGSGGKTTYFFMDGSEKRTKFLQNLEIVDNNKLILGSNDNSYLKYDSTASQLFISGDSKFLSDAYVVNNLNVQKSVYQTATGGFYINKPYGADFYTTTNDYTGAIEIALPTGGTGHDDMIKFVVDIFDYRTQESVTVFVGGYTYQNVGSGNTTWYYVSATVLGQSANQNYTVRFGDNGTEHCVWIGDTTSTWNHLQVIVRDFFAGYTADINNYLGAWDINVVTTQTTVNNTLTNCFPMSSDTITGYLPLTGGTVTGNVLLGSNTNISMDASANGQLMIDGVGYQGAIALDENAMHIYHNSSSRSLVLGTNETARLTIDGGGSASTFSTTYLTVGGEGYIRSDDSGYLHFQGGTTGTRFYNNSNNVAHFTILDNGTSTFSGDLTSASLSAASIGISGTNGTDGKGISLYGGAYSGEPSYGMMFQQTATYGTFGYVSGDWATYFTMNSNSNRGWIFRKVGVGNVASINNDGRATFNTPSKFYTNDSELFIQDAGTNAVQINTGAGDELYIGSNNSYQFRGTTTGQAQLNSVGYVGVFAGASNYTGLQIYQTDGSTVGFIYGDSGQTSNPGIGILDSDGNWAVRVRRDISVDLRVNDVQKFNVTTAINYNFQPTWIEGGSANWNETTPGLTTGSLHLVPVSTDNFGSAITFGASDSSSGTSANAGIYTRTDATYGTKMYFATTDSYVSGSKTRMMIDYTGNVGIGTESPNAKLEVEDATPVIQIKGTGVGVMGFKTLDGGGVVGGLTYDSSTGEQRLVGAASYVFQTMYTGGSERMRINQYGQLLINATSSGSSSNLYGYNLGVRGNSSQAFISIARDTQTLDTQGVIIGLDTNHSYFISRDAIPIEFHTNNTVRMHIHGSANQVGIGGDPVSVAGVNNFLMVKGSAHSGIVLNDTDVAQTNEIWNDGGNLIFWDQIRGYKMQLYSNGNAEFYYDTTSRTFGVAQTSGTTGQGISLYGGASAGEPTYGMMFMQTATFGTYGQVVGDWATYFTMNNSTTRGWIFRRVGSGNCASISGNGDLSLNGIIVFPNTNQRIAGLNSTYIQFKSGSASDVGINLVNTNGGNLMYLYGNGSDKGMLNSGGYWTFRHSQGGDTNLYAGNQTHVWQFSSSNGYAYFPSWINLGGGAGIYSATNSAHFYPNNAGSYSTWRLDGSKGGYTGIHMSYGNGVNVGMYDSSGNGGNWQNTAGWHFYYHQANSCLGVGSSNTSSAYSLYVTGSIYSTVDVIAYSDKRAKENIVTVDGAIEKVNKLRGVYYTLKEGDDKSRKVGVIAQEILQVLPEVVTYDNDNDKYGVDYGKITGLLIEAIKDQQKQIDKLTKFVDKLNK